MPNAPQVTTPRVDAVVGAAVMTTLLHVAAAGVDDDTAGVFLRCWAKERGQSPEEAAGTLAIAARRFAGVADEGLLVTANRWIHALAVDRGARSKVLHFLLGRGAATSTPTGGRRVDGTPRARRSSS